MEEFIKYGLKMLVDAPDAERFHRRHLLLMTCRKFLDAYDALTDAEKDTDDVKAIYGGVYAALLHYNLGVVICSARRKEGWN